MRGVQQLLHPGRRAAGPQQLGPQPGQQGGAAEENGEYDTEYDLATAPAEVGGEAGVVEAGGRESVAGEGEHGAELVRQPRHVVQRTHVRHPAYTHLPTNF